MGRIADSQAEVGRWERWRRLRQAESDIGIGALSRVGAGAKGRYPGRIPYELRIPSYLGSVNAMRVLYPWVAMPPIPPDGPAMGRVIGGGWRYHSDVWVQRERKIVEDFSIMIAGVIGSAKSAWAKTLMLRHVAFGRPFVIPADIRGEWGVVARAVDGLVLVLGPGQPQRLNVLAYPARPTGMSEDRWWEVVRTHWAEVLGAVITTMLPGQRDLTVTETAGIEAALQEATGVCSATTSPDQAHPIHLRLIVDLLLDPSPWMTSQLRLPGDRAQDELRDIGLTLRRATEGSLRGLVDSDQASNHIDPARPATVIDISRVQSSPAAKAIVTACAQAACELAFAHRVQQWIIGYDETWQHMAFPAILRRINYGQRICRGTGASTVIITHRLSDGRRGGAEGIAAMADLIADCSTKIVYRQRSDALADLQQLIPMSEPVAAVLPTLERGTAVHFLDDRPYIVQHLIAPSRPGITSEWSVVETDVGMQDEYRSLDGYSRTALGLEST